MAVSKRLIESASTLLVEDAGNRVLESSTGTPATVTGAAALAGSGAVWAAGLGAVVAGEIVLETGADTDPILLEEGTDLLLEGTPPDVVGPFTTTYDNWGDGSGI